jgi:hypothetical protein
VGKVQRIVTSDPPDLEVLASRLISVLGPTSG